MVKNKIAYAASLTALILGSGMFSSAVFADEVTLVGTADELAIAVLNQASNIKLTGDIIASSCVRAENNWLGYFDISTVLDLDGHTITQAEGCDDFYVRDGGDLTIIGGGKIVKGYDDADSDVFYVIGDENRGGGRLTLKDVEIVATGYGVRMKGVDTELILDDGTITTSGDYGVAAFENSVVTVNGGRISSNGFAISGNGNNDSAGAKFYVNGGELISNNDYAIYLPQIDGVLEITGGEITGGAGAIAANRGSINITGGTLKSLGTAEVSGDASQDGTRGYDNAVIGIAKEYGPVTLTISGGTFINQNGAELIADVSGLDNENEATVEISGGIFSEAPEEDEIVEGFEADVNEEGTGYEIFPKRIDMQENGEMVSDDSLVGAVAGSATFTQEFIADRKAKFEIATLDTNEFEALVVGEEGGDLVAGFDVSLWDRNYAVIDVNGTEIKVRIVLSEEQYQALSAYDKVVAINFDEQGNEVDRFDATLVEEDGEYFAEFTTTHMSTYGLAGVNEDETSDAATPETGTVTREGASAISAAILTAVAVGLLVAIITFTFLIRRI